MGQRISGTGVGLVLPQYLYPSELNPAQVAPDIGNAFVGLAPGQALPVPAGAWYIRGGKYCVKQYLDPVSGTWRMLGTVRQDLDYLLSDGFNFRIANLTGCPVAAVVTAGGNGYTSTPTVTAGTGTSTWQAIVGGQLSVTTVANAGSGYGLPPLIFFAAPPNPGVQAQAVCVLTGGSVSAVTMLDVGAGYVTAPTAVIVPDPYDPNLTNNTTITAATVTMAVVGAGSISAVLCTNPGVSISAAPVLTVAGGGGSGANVNAVLLTTLVSATVASAGTWTGGAFLTSFGGGNGTTSWITSPESNQSGFIDRPIQALLSGGSNSLTSISTLYDGGLQLAAPTIVVMPVSGNAAGTSATITATYGGANDSILLQPAP